MTYAAWTKVPLAKVASDLQPGFACRPTLNANGALQLRPLNMTIEGTITLGGTKAVECSSGQKSKYHLAPLDVIFNNTNSPDLVGKVVFFDLVGDFVFSNHLTRIRVDRNRLLPQFLHRFLYLLWCQGYFKHQCTQWVNQAAINKDALAAIEVPLPPLAEQERIVRILDEVEELRKLRAQADRRTADFIPALFHDMFGDKSHPVRRLSQVAEVVSGVAKGRRFNGQTPVSVPYIRVANVQAGYLDLSEIKTIEALWSEIKELELKSGDVLLTEGGDFDKLGRGAMWEQEIPNCIHQNHIFRVRVDWSDLLPVYFEKFLQTSEAKTYFLGCAKRTTNLASINMTQLRDLPVPIPPLSLQREFAVRVAEVRAMEAQQAESRRRLDDLFHSLLHRAFRGEL